MTGKVHKLNILKDEFEDAAADLGKLLALCGYATSSKHKLTVGFETEEEAGDAHEALAKMSIAYKKLFDFQSETEAKP